MTAWLYDPIARVVRWTDGVERYELRTGPIGSDANRGRRLHVFPTAILRFAETYGRILILRPLRHTISNDKMGVVYSQVGQLRVLCAQEDTAIAEITYACDPVVLGDGTGKFRARFLEKIRPFLGIEMLDTNIAHILRAIMCLYLALGLFWLYSAFNEAYRNPALLTVILFTGGLVTGRIISYFADGQPQPILILYIGLEFVLVPMAYWVFRLPE